MITHQTIKSTSWEAITTAGQNGTCWIWENIRGDGAVLISHSDTGSPPAAQTGYRLTTPVRNNQPLIIGADNDNDVYYARNMTAGARVKIQVDVK